MGLDFVGGRTGPAADIGEHRTAVATAVVQAAVEGGRIAQAAGSAGLRIAAAIAAVQAVVERDNLVEA